MGGVAVNFYVEDVSATGQVVVGGLDFGFMAGAALVVHGHVVGVGVIITVRNARQAAELLAVYTCELARQPFGRRGQYAVIMLVLVGELVGTVAHVSHDSESQFLSLFRLSVMLAQKRHKTFRQTDEPDAQRTLIDYGRDVVVRFELVAAYPQSGHQQRELLGERCFLELHAFMQLACGDVEHGIQLGEETGDALFLIRNAHALYGKAHNVDCGERQVAASDGCLGAETVLEYACTASHGGYFVLVAFRVVGFPVVTLVEGGVQVQEVREETACGDLAGKLVEVVVAVFGQIAYAAFLFPYLNGEDGRFAVAHALVRAFQQFADDAASLGGSIRTVVDGAEYHLVAAARVYRVHVVDERFHGLMHAGYGLVHGMLDDALLAGEAVQRLLQVIGELFPVEM